jgi:hypothetical protein
MSAPALALVPKRFSLYEHVRDVEGIADIVEALDPEDIDPDVAEQLAAALCAAIAGTKDKIDRTTSVLMQFETAEAAAKAEASRLEARAKYFARQRERLEAYCLAVLDASKLERIEGNTSAIARRKNPPKVVIDDERELPPEFWRSPPVPPIPADQPDKGAIAKALKADPESVPGCRLHRNYRLQRS